MDELVDGMRKNTSKSKIQLDGLTAEVGLTPVDRLVGHDKKSLDTSGWAVSSLVDVVQGVTWGGEGCEEIFVSSTKPDIEEQLAYKTVGGRDVSSDEIKWQGTYLIFPYLRNAQKWEPAFGESLDLSQLVDQEEQRLTGNPLDMVKHRIARHIGNLERFPKTAQYLVRYYERLREREFEGKNITEWGKAWYEYHRERTPRLTTTPKILSPRLVHEPCFAVDDVGYLPRDSIVALIPRSDSVRYAELVRALGGDVEALRFMAHYLNSAFGKALAGRRVRRQGDYIQIDKDFLGKVVIKEPDGNRR